MKACLDVHYLTNTACAAAVIFNNWTDTTPLNRYTEFVQDNKAYEPGKFYLRELKPLMAVIEQIKEPIQIYLIDAYCYLSSGNEPGLGAYLYAATGGRSAIIGVAKNRFRDTHHATEVVRGNSKRPLYVTSIGLSQEEAAALVSVMAGEFRIPTLLKAVDQLARISHQS
jgi:deoxyribonuclease V